MKGLLLKRYDLCSSSGLFIVIYLRKASVTDCSYFIFTIFVSPYLHYEKTQTIVDKGGSCKDKFPAVSKAKGRQKM